MEEAHNAVNLYDLGKIKEADENAGAGSAKVASDASASAKLNAKAANNEAGKAQRKADIVGERADDLLAKYTAAAANIESEKNKRLALAASLLDREFHDQSGAMAELSRFPPTQVVFDFSDDKEPTKIAEQINFVISGAQHWPMAWRKQNDEKVFWEGIAISPGTLTPRTNPSGGLGGLG